MSTWADVALGDTVKGKDGNGWAVAKIANKDKGVSRAISIHSTTGKPSSFDLVVKAADAVEILERAAPAIAGVEPTDLAAAVVVATIGGEVISRDGGDGLPPRSPKTFQHVGALLGHLYVQHGIRDLPTAPKAAEEHAQHHEDVLAGSRRQGYSDHTHED